MSTESGAQHTWITTYRMRGDYRSEGALRAALTNARERALQDRPEASVYVIGYHHTPHGISVQVGRIRQ
jgi:hypothetical protein